MIQDKTVAAVVVAAGKSNRMGFDKMFYLLDGVEVLRHSVGRMDAHPAVDRLVVVAGENRDEVRRLFAQHPPRKPLVVVEGGDSRTASVASGVAACTGADLVAIHDGARPFVSEGVITRALAAAADMGAAAPAVPVKDTIKQVGEGELVEATLPRARLRQVQTPQVFARAAFMRALALVRPEDYLSITDDCMVMEMAGLPVCLVEGEEANRKITTPADLPPPEQGKAALLPRVGHGYDVHRLVPDRALILGGVAIPHELGLLGHSDADVLLHAVADALLGAAALGDIGKHFPDNDPAYKGADSLVLLSRVARLLREAGWRVGSLDATLLCQQPKLAPHIPAMRKNIALALSVEVDAVSVKATTEEGLGFTGAGQGIAAHCVAVIQG